MDTTTATVRLHDDAERRWFCGGGLHTWLATEAETGGAYLMFEDVLDQGKVTPLHRHPDSDETFYMLEGEVVVHIEGAEHTLGAGGIAIVPRGMSHAFKVTSPQARMLCLQTPGTGEAFYRMASEAFVDGEPATPVNSARVGAAAAQTHAIEILGPPPF